MATDRDWIDAGLRALVAGGPEAVRVEPLAKAMKVTKGSFYWHFADRGALLDAILDRWETVATQGVIDRVDRVSGGPRAQLEALLEITSQSDTAPRLEGAIRAWSASDPRAAKVTKRVDKLRERYVADLLVAAGLARQLAEQRSRILYLALLGEFSLVGNGGRRSGPAPFVELLRLVLT
jgi:AcrR family transcriptional regulator